MIADPKYIEILEAALISEAVFHKDAFQEIGPILKSENFSHGEEVSGIPINRAIWKCLEEMYPKEQISIVSVCHKFKKMYGVDKTYYILSLTDKLGAGMNRQQHCFILLEHQLRESFIKLASSFISKHSTNLMIHEDLKQIVDYVKNPTNDVFDSIEVVLKYFSKSENFDKEKNQILDFKEKVAKRVLQIKEVYPVKNLFDSINSYYNFPSRRRVCIQSLVDLLRYCMVSSEVPGIVQQEIIELRERTLK